MDIKLKSKLLNAVIFLLTVYMLSISLLAGFDFLRYRGYVLKNPYFGSGSYVHDLQDYFENVRLLITDYKGYSTKADDDKLNVQEKQLLSKSQDTVLKDKQAAIENEYKNLIGETQKQKDKNKEAALIEERDKKLAELKNSAGRILEELKKDAVLKKDMTYESIIKNLDYKRSIKYYIRGKKAGEVYTNLEKDNEVDDFIRKNSLYVESFPRSPVKYKELQGINNWFLTNGYEGKFIFLKTSEGFSQMEDNIRYYNSIRERVIKEGILGIVLLLTGAALLVFLRFRTGSKIEFNGWVDIKYERIPIDLRGFIFLVYSAFIWAYLRNTVFFYLPIGSGHVIKLTTVAIYCIYLLFNLQYGPYLLKNKEKFGIQLRESISYQIYYLLRESFKARRMVYKAGLVFTLTVFLGVAVIAGLISFFGRGKELFLLSAGYIFFYMLLVPVYVLKRVVWLNRIIDGTEEMVSGNLDCILEVPKDDNLSKLSSNINNMKEGFKKSVESQIKSERLKTELITNVSHDLKTPLTSIINYVSLLKNGGLTEEKGKYYIEVLEQKSQRLKILIEDLFEASKMSSGAVELNIESADITSLLRQALGEFDEKIRNSSLTFRVNIPVEEIYLQLDGKKTWRVFENLIGNALKYSQPESRVYVDLLEEKDRVKVVIKNMSAYELDFKVDEIFERFKRGDKARSTEGSGLGLSIAKSIVELQGGRMSIEVDGDLFKVIVEFKK